MAHAYVLSLLHMANISSCRRLSWWRTSLSRTPSPPTAPPTSTTLNRPCTTVLASVSSMSSGWGKGSTPPTQTPRNISNIGCASTPQNLSPTSASGRGRLLGCSIRPNAAPVPASSSSYPGGVTLSPITHPGVDRMMTSRDMGTPTASTS